jgi:pyruvate dehydrogenase E1 component alpha subunit
LSKEDLLKAYRKMREIREFEDRLHKEFATGTVPGFVHLYSGEEAVAVGVCENLNDKDRIASTHRGHGHCIAKNVDIMGMMAEIYGKATGTCGGKGGSMHIADLDHGMLGANGIVGAGPPLICGAALASKLRKDGSIGVVFFGDGASNQGTNFESMNLAVTWNLPMIFVLENNGYAESTSVKYSANVGTDNVADRARGFGMPAVTVDGNDFFAVYEAAAEAIERARKGGGPTYIECKTLRYFGHFEGDAQTYRPKDEVANARANDCPLKRFAKAVTEAGLIEAAELEAIDKEVLALIDKSVAEAQKAPQPELSELLTDVYVSY